jgi:5'-3' exonuclease
MVRRSIGAERSSCPSTENNRVVIVHLIDGTYELFRHFYGLRRFTKGRDRPFGAVVGVLNTVLQMIGEGATHIGVATDHVIESFRNELWSGYKTGDGIDPALLAQFEPLEDALAAMGVVVWPMTEFEADDALASAAALASKDSRVPVTGTYSNRYIFSVYAIARTPRAKSSCECRGIGGNLLRSKGD